VTYAQHTEVERKYDVPNRAVVPPLHKLGGVSAVGQPEPLFLEAVYFDTPDLALAAAGITLRRRTGGDDAGWHLKLPVSSQERTEGRLPLGDDQDGVPSVLLDRARVHVRDHPVQPVTKICTRRLVHRLLDDEGTVLAEICDDDVTATSPSGEAADLRWREWEVELVDGPVSLLDKVEGKLLAVGAARSNSPSKLVRAMGDRMPTTSGSRRWTNGRIISIAELLDSHMTEQLTRLKRQDMQCRENASASVHKLRIASRRLRAALATYRPVFLPGTTEDLRVELKWLGQVLAGARDTQVMRERLDEMVRTQPDELVLGPVGQLIDEELGASSEAGRAATMAALESERYFRLLDALDDFVRTPPYAKAAARLARRDLPRLLQRDWKRVRRADRTARRATDPSERDNALHEVRKSAKRLRYAAESTIPVLGKRAKQLAKMAGRIQEVLGEHQDTTVTRKTLREIGIRAHLSGENGFTFGRLHALEEMRATELERQYPALLARFPSDVGRWVKR
jgi:CHAD domain-containing protein